MVVCHMTNILMACVVFTLSVKAQTATNHNKRSMWTTWERWSECTQTCDVGIKSRKRICVGKENNKLVRRHQSLCPGPETEIATCKQKPCPINAPSPREAQCYAMNIKILWGMQFEWVPYLKGGNPCLLRCMAKKYQFYYGFGAVTDGTPCNSDTDDICVNGLCRTLGCEGKIGSLQRLDNCGICGGQNRKCFHFKSTFSDDTPENGNYGYTFVSKIPAGATYVTVKDNGKNYLAMADSKMGYIFNGNFKVGTSRKLNVSGTLIDYRVEDDRREVIKIKGPTTEDLNLMLIFLERNPGVSYEYWIPREKFINIHNLLRQQKRNRKGKNPRLQAHPRYDHHPLYRPRQQQINSHSHEERKQPERQVVATARPTTPRFQTTTQNVVTSRSVFVIHSNWHQNRQSQSKITAGNQNQARQRNSHAHVHPRRGQQNRFSNQGSCPVCHSVKWSKEQYCKSDFAVKIRIMHFRVINGHTRYDVKIVRTYRNTLHLMSREYLWVPNKCLCPKMERHKLYIATGHLAEHTQNRESRLTVTKNDFVHRDHPSSERHISQMDRNSCTKNKL